MEVFGIVVENLWFFNQQVIRFSLTTCLLLLAEGAVCIYKMIHLPKCKGDALITYQHTVQIICPEKHVSHRECPI